MNVNLTFGDLKNVGNEWENMIVKCDLVNEINESQKSNECQTIFPFEVVSFENYDNIILDIQRNFYLTMNSKDLKITKIIRFNGKYLLFQQTMFHHVLNYYKSKLQEKLLFDTNLNSIPKVVQNDFNCDFNQRSLYGKGVYFGANAKYCSIFESNNYNNIKTNSKYNH